MESIETRFWAKVNKQGPKRKKMPTRCWVWTGATSHGYGKFGIAGKMVGAHIFAYCLKNGEVPAGLEIDHLCRRPECVRPSHLEAVTHTENVLRGKGFGAINARKTHCPKGHPYDDQNTIWDSYKERIGRRCRKCYRLGTGHRNARKTHCVNGHPFSQSNTVINVRGDRVCLACRREVDRRRYRGRKEG